MKNNSKTNSQVTHKETKRKNVEKESANQNVVVSQKVNGYLRWNVINFYIIFICFNPSFQPLVSLQNFYSKWKLLTNVIGVES